MQKFSLVLILLLVLVISITIFGCGGNDSKGESGGSQGEKTASYKDITAEELKTMMETNKNLVVVDVREQYEWNDGHLAGSILIPTSEFQNRVSELPKEKAIALVCQSGARSSQVADYLIKLGYNEVYNLKGGTSRWPYELVK